jgi:Co/Zn/Cd efflux system component
MLTSLVCGSAEFSHQIARRLQELRQAHAELYDLDEAVMNAFDYPLLLDLLMVTINIIQGLYFGSVCLLSKAGR